MKNNKELYSIENGTVEQGKIDSKLNDVELDQVTGGTEGEVITRMRCDRCLGELEWKGDYLNGVYYECRMCWEHNLVKSCTLHGFAYKE